jgi:hypothetical protein
MIHVADTTGFDVKGSNATATAESGLVVSTMVDRDALTPTTSSVDRSRSAVLDTEAILGLSPTTERIFFRLQRTIHRGKY